MEYFSKRLLLLKTCIFAGYMLRFDAKNFVRIVRFLFFIGSKINRFSSIKERGTSITVLRNGYALSIFPPVIHALRSYTEKKIGRKVEKKKNSACDLAESIKRKKEQKRKKKILTFVS